MACRPNARSLAVSQGKGLTPEAAKVSGIMESIELHHAENVASADVPRRRTSFERLSPTAAALDPVTLPQHCPGSAKPDEQLDWVMGWDLIKDIATWVPLGVLDLDTTRIGPAASGLTASTTGLASGNAANEALSHGVCEVIERDAASCWRRLKAAEKHATRLNVRTVDDPTCRMLLDLYDAADIAVGLWDLTPSDVPLATFCCEIVDRRDARVTGRVSGGGYGAHPDRGIALARALTEAAQSRLTAISGAREDIAESDYLSAPSSREDNYRDHLLGLMATGDFRRVPHFEADSIDDDLDHELTVLERARVRQVVAVELTRADLGVSVFKVIIPAFDDEADGPSAANLGAGP